MFKREYCTTREAAAVLGVSLRTAQLWVDSGILEAWKTEGGHRRISVASVERLVRMNKGGSDSSPANPATVSAEEAAAQPLPLKVLVVEDDNTLIKLYRTFLESWKLPLRVSTASNGYEALVLIGREQPDLMITDLNMPGLDGYQMVRTLATSSFREGMEIIVVSGMDDEDIAAHGGIPPNIPLFKKPIPFNQLRSIIEAMLDRRNAFMQRS